jgi:hypothetical protein
MKFENLLLGRQRRCENSSDQVSGGSLKDDGSLRKCTFPPTPMLTVGYLDRTCADNKRVGDPVYKCPKCGYDTAAPFNYTPTVYCYAY